MKFNSKAVLAVLSAITITGAMLAVLEGDGPTRMVGKERHCVAYQDIASVWTIGRGLTYVNGKRVTPDLSLPESECRHLEAIEHKKAEDHVRKRLRREPTVNQLAAMTSFTYNVGNAGFDSSSVLRLFNAGDAVGSCHAMMKWVCITVPAGQGDADGICQSKATNKQFSRGLQNRRVIERGVCLKEPSIWKRVLAWVGA